MSFSSSSSYSSDTDSEISLEGPYNVREPEQPTPAPPETNTFTTAYLHHANQIISSLVKGGKAHEVSRARIEMEILSLVDTADFPLSCRIAVHYLLLSSNTYDVYWLGQKQLHGLSDEAITRVQPDLSILDSVLFEHGDEPEPEPVASCESSPEIPLWQVRGLDLPREKRDTRVEKAESPEYGLATPSITASREELPHDDFEDDDDDDDINDDTSPRYKTRSKTPKVRFDSPGSDDSYRAPTPGVEESRFSSGSPIPEFSGDAVDSVAESVEPHYGGKGGKTIAHPTATNDAITKRARGKTARGGSTRASSAKASAAKKETTTEASTRGTTTKGKRGGVRKTTASKTPRKPPSTRGKGKGKSVE